MKIFQARHDPLVSSKIMGPANTETLPKALFYADVPPVFCLSAGQKTALMTPSGFKIPPLFLPNKTDTNPGVLCSLDHVVSAPPKKNPSQNPLAVFSASGHGLNRTDSFYSYSPLIERALKHRYLSAEEEKAHGRIIQENKQKIVEILLNHSVRSPKKMYTDFAQACKNKASPLYTWNEPFLGALKEYQKEDLLNDEEKQIFLDFKRALGTLVIHNYRLVSSIAKKYSRPDSPFEDLFSVGVAGLIIAAEKFDPARNIRFVTLARWWVRAEVHRFSGHEHAKISKSGAIKEISEHAARAVSYLRSRHMREPTAGDVARFLGIPIETYDRIQTAQASILSLFEPVGGHEDSKTAEELVEDSEAIIADRGINQQTLKHEIIKEVSRLSRRQFFAVCCYYGFFEEREYAVKDIADLLAVSESHVYQLLSSAKHKISQDSSAYFYETLKKTEKTHQGKNMNRMALRLNEEEVVALVLKLGLFKESLSLRAIGAFFGCTGETIRKDLQKALDTLKQSSRLKDLLLALDMTGF